MNQFSTVHKLWTSSAAHLRVSVQREDLLLGVKQLAGVRDVDGRLLLVPRQHPYLQASLPQGSDGLGNAVLQTVLDARRPCGSK